jgi:predicted acetyltransferase
MLCFFGFGTVSVDMIGVALVFVDVRYRSSGSVRDRLLDIELK